MENTDRRPERATGGTDGRESGKRSRRAVLRRAGTALAGGVALAAGPDAALARRCPRTANYWRTHPDEWPTFRDGACFLLLDGDGAEQAIHPNGDRSRLLGVLSRSPGEDCYLHLARQYVAALLNRRAIDSHPRVYRDFWEWIARYHRWVRDADRPQREWTVGGVNGAAVNAYLRRWNGGVGWRCGEEAAVTPDPEVRQF